MNASTPAFFNALANVAWRSRNSCLVIGGMERREVCGWRVDQAHVSRVLEVGLWVGW